MSNLSNVDEDNDRLRQDTAYYVLNFSASAILLGLICCGNMLILYLVVKHRGMQMTAVRNLLIAGMAVHDLVTGLVVTPLHIVNVLELEHITEIACLASNAPTFAIHIVSGYTPLLLAIERFIAIIFPFKHPAIVTEKKVYFCLSMIWFYGIFVGCLPLMGWNNLDDEDRITYCHVEHFVDGHYLGFIYMVNVVPCMVAQLLIYAKIIHTAQVKARQISMEQKRCGVPPHITSNTRADRSGLWVLALSSVFFIASYLPIILETAIDFKFYTAKSLQGDMWSSVLFSIGDLLILANSAFNPVFYAFSNKDFRVHIRRMVKRLQH